MNWESLIQDYGYWAILVGTFFEGETILILGGFASQRGYLELPWVVVTAFVGTLCGDQFYFILGRWQGQAILQKRPVWKEKAQKANILLDQYRIPLILSFRFLLGLRSVVAVAIGMSSIPTLHFVLLNTVGAAIWAVAVGIGGYLFGNALELLLGNIKRYEAPLFVSMAGVGVLIWGIHFIRRRKGNENMGAL